MIYALAAVSVIIHGYGSYHIVSHTTFDFSPISDASGQKWRNNFASSMNIKRLTESGREQLAAISPDGNQIVYVSREDDRQGLWIRETEEARQLVAPDAVLIAGLTFSPDGQTYLLHGLGTKFYHAQFIPRRGRWRRCAAVGFRAGQ